MTNSTSNNNFGMRNNANTKIGGSTLYEDSQNYDLNLKNNINHFIPNKNNYEPKKKNILAAIDINKNYYDKKRPYSANKLNYLDNYPNHSKANLNKPRSANNKIKAHDNLDLGNYQDLRNINADNYQALIDKITKEYGDIDAELILAYIRNIENNNNNNLNNDIQIIENDNPETNRHDDYNRKVLINNQDISEINVNNNSEQIQREDLGEENEDNFYNQDDFENN